MCGGKIMLLLKFNKQQTLDYGVILSNGETLQGVPTNVLTFPDGSKEYVGIEEDSDGNEVNFYMIRFRKDESVCKLLQYLNDNNIKFE
jgi:hypothetical protein